MELTQIVSQLKSERDRLDRAIIALESIIGHNPARRMRKAHRAMKATSKVTTINTARRRLSAAARHRISLAQRRRWAARRKAS